LLANELGWVSMQTHSDIARMAPTARRPEALRA
jgi:hypothetical protein